MRQPRIMRQFRSLMAILFSFILASILLMSLFLKSGVQALGEFNEHYFDIIQLQSEFENSSNYYSLYIETKDLYYLERFQSSKLGLMNIMNDVKLKVNDKDSLRLVDGIENYLESYDRQTLAGITAAGANSASLSFVIFAINEAVANLLHNEMLLNNSDYSSQAQEFTDYIGRALLLIVLLLLLAFFILYFSLHGGLKTLGYIDIAIKDSKNGRYKAVIPEYYGDNEIQDIRNFSDNTLRSINKFYERDLKEIIHTEKMLAETKNELELISKVQRDEHFSISITEMRDRIYFDMVKDIYTFAKMHRGSGIETVLGEFQTLLEEMFVRRHENKLARELSNLGKYMTFQNSRMGGDIEYRSDCRVDSEEADFPNYTLLALVHNIFKTNFDNHRTKGKIKLKAYKKNQELTIVLIDTGYVITEQYPKLAEKFHKGNAVALKLLQSYFEGRITYKYYSKRGCGNIFTLKIYTKELPNG